MARIGGGVYKLPGGKVEGIPARMSGVPSSSKGSGLAKAGGKQAPSNPKSAAQFGLNMAKNTPNVNNTKSTAM